MVECPVISDQMDVIWKREQFIKCSRESLPPPTLASGDACDQHCCLCQSSSHLHLITKERLDETLRLYFGVNVPPNRLICESCIKCMKITEGFSALVHASFGRISQGSSRHSKILSDSQGTTTLGVPLANQQKKNLSLLKTKISLERGPPPKHIKNSSNDSTMVKKVLACIECGQKYLMCMSFGESKFICSRCQKNWGKETKKYSVLSRVNGLCCNTDLKSCRIRTTTQSLQVKPNPSTVPPAAHQRNQCPRKYAAGQLESHVNCFHISLKPCAVCGRTFKSADALKSHLKEHSRTEGKVFTDCKRLKGRIDRQPLSNHKSK